jgi:copper homeostasis protein (lipoprotein)
MRASGWIGTAPWRGALAGGAALLLTACGGGDALPDGMSRAGTAAVRESVVTVPSVPTVTVAAIAPASYQGTLPCADCSGIATTLTVFTDSTFRLSERYEGRSAQALVRMGRWSFDGRRLVLESQMDTVRQLELTHGDTLRLLDTAGQPISGSAPLTLARTDSLVGLRAVASWVGTFTYQADAPTFRECGSGQSYAVLLRGAYRELERAYLAAKLPRGSGQQVEVTGRFLPKPANMEGYDREVLEVTSYVGPGANPECR